MDVPFAFQKAHTEHFSVFIPPETAEKGVFMTLRNEIKSYIVRAGMSMQDAVDLLADEYGWSRSVPNLSGKLSRESLRYKEAVQLADVLGYELVWQPKERR